jgi:DNA-binding NarL/FixJ family response regulator
MRTQIVLVEDDPQDAKHIREALEERLNAQVEVISSEKAFVDRIATFARNPPQLIVFDVMLRWASPSEDLEREVREGKVPQEVVEQGFLRAGIRCVQRLKSREDTAKVPYVLYTGLQVNNFVNETVVHITEIITKSEDIRPLVEAVRARLAKR